jgi:DcuC family C4-dicarboxylate transporter
MTALASLLVIALTVYAILRRAEVRLVLLLGALALGALAGKPQAILYTFFEYFSREQFLLPLGCCMGFAHVLRHTECDQHLVHLLVRPLRPVRPLLVPGVALVGFLVNVPIVSQTGTLAVVGPVLVPLLRAAGASPVTTGAALVLGTSMGGELLNPGAPEFGTVAGAVNDSPQREARHQPKVDRRDCVAHTWPLLLVHVAVTVPLFWLATCRAEAREARRAEARAAMAKAVAPPPEAAAFRVNVLKALVPLVPLALLLLTSLPQFHVFSVPQEWLVPAGSPGRFGSRLIAAAMLVGVAVAALSSPGKAGGTATAFFQGVGYTVTNVISVIVVANCFGEGIRLSGLDNHLGEALVAAPALLLPAAALVPLAFAWVCGSGMATTQTLFRFYVEPAYALGHDPLQVGAVVALAAAGGRTMSPVAAVVLLSASLSGAESLALVRRTALPVLAGLSAVVAASMVFR